MNKELETIIENEFNCLINDLGCLIGEEWKAEAIKKVVNQAFVLGGVSGWIWIYKDYPNEVDKYYTVLDKYGNIEENVFFGNSGFINEPYSFFEGKRVKAKHIIAYR